MRTGYRLWRNWTIAYVVLAACTASVTAAGAAMSGRPETVFLVPAIVLAVVSALHTLAIRPEYTRRMQARTASVYADGHDAQSSCGTATGALPLTTPATIRARDHHPAPPPAGRRLSGVRLGVAFLLIWLGCGVIGALLISAMDHSNQALYSRLEHHGVAVNAVVTGTQPSNHNTVFYSFVADGRTYSSSDVSWPPNPEASQLAVGDKVYVVYDARDPNVSCACDPRAAAVPAQWWRRLIAGLFLGSIIAVVITRRLFVSRRVASRWNWKTIGP